MEKYQKHPPSYPLGYPKSVYHKDYNPHAPNHEAYLKLHCKLVKSQEEMDELGSDWGDHPSVKVVVVEEKKPVTRNKPKAE